MPGEGADPAVEEMLRDAKEQSSQAERALLEIKVTTPIRNQRVHEGGELKTFCEYFVLWAIISSSI